MNQPPKEIESVAKFVDDRQIQCDNAGQDPDLNRHAWNNSHAWLEWNADIKTDTEGSTDGR